MNTLVAAGLDHPNIAAPVAAGTDDGAAYLVQEFAIGDSLDVVLREGGPMTLETAVPLVTSLAAAIDHAAARGVQHGALHMRDIIVASDGGARITGFGIFDALAKISAKLPTRPQYSSPDGASDVYSLGAIAFEMLTAKRVSVPNFADLERAHGAELRAAFEAALAPSAGLRATRAGDFADGLRRAARMRPQGPPPVPEPPAPVLIEVIPPSVAEPVDDLQLRSEVPADILGEPRIERAASRDDPAGAPRSQWLILAIFLISAALAAVVVLMFVRQRAPQTATAPSSGVAETTVEVPPSKPEVSAAPSQPAPAAREPQVGSTATPKPPVQSPAPRARASGAPLVERRDGSQKPVRGSLLIRSTPADADVFLDGRLSGKTPTAVRDLPLGSYTIRVSRPGYATEQRTIDLTTRRPTAATLFELQSAASRDGAPTAGQDGPAPDSVGRLFVQSKPPNARVFVDERPIGTTPLSLLDVPAGTAMVRIELDGYETWTTRVRVNGGEQTRVTASLERK